MKARVLSPTNGGNEANNTRAEVATKENAQPRFSPIRRLAEITFIEDAELGETAFSFRQIFGSRKFNRQLL